MTGAPVLIAAYSGRALAQSARRAGYVPLVADGFCDRDTVDCAVATRRVPIVGGRFHAKSLYAALESLVAEADEVPIGLVLGAGFEATPKLVARLAERFTLIGNSAEAIERSKNPEIFFGILHRIGVRHPETRSTPPDTAEGWLRKRVGGSGGLHVEDWPCRDPSGPGHYFQRKVAGDQISVLGILGASCTFAYSRQWTSPSARTPYRYGGAVSLAHLDPDLEARMIDVALHVRRELGLVGLVSFDFIVADEEPLLIEVNPRPGATLDVLDDSNGTLFAAHVEGSRPHGDPATFVLRSWAQPPVRAAAYLYADRGPLDIGPIDWPSWTADRPCADSHIARHEPIATVIAEAKNDHDAQHLCLTRLGLLAQLLYGIHASEKELH